MRHRERTLALVAMVAALSGCYSYSQAGAPHPGMEVRAQLETEAAVRRSQDLDEPITRYDGTIVEVNQEMLMLDVLVARAMSAFQDVEIRDTIRLQRTEVRAIMERRISPGKTALFTVGMAAAAVVVVLGIDAVVGGTTDDGGRPGEPALRFPLVEWTGSRLLPALLGIGREP